MFNDVGKEVIVASQVLPATGRLELRILGDLPGVFTVDAPAVEGYVLGRSDANNSYIPDIDLAEFDAHKNGVSRRHAVLVRYQDYVHVVDLHSVNGSFLNNERLDAEVPYPLSEGDHLRLGNLTLIIAVVKS